MPLQATSGAASYDGFGGGVAAVPQYIEDVFSTYLYTGNGSTQTITNGIDATGKGALTWLKCRSRSATNHFLWDTVNGPSKRLFSNLTNGGSNWTGYLDNTSSGFTVTSDGTVNGPNYSGDTYSSWTFRKQPKFFDVVTYTGTGSTSTEITHNLGSAPGMVICKKINSTSDWAVWHRGSGGNTDVTGFELNSTVAAQNNPAGYSTLFTSTTFRPQFVGSSNDNANNVGATYVAYLFAHNAGGFGLTGTDNVISCGSFTTDATTGAATVNLGWEPQWILTKMSNGLSNWTLFDNMRGMSLTNSQELSANASSGESSPGSADIFPSATGFSVDYLSGSGQFGKNKNIIYIAIRRGPMKVPTDATKVFAPITWTGTGTTTSITGVGFPPDVALYDRRGGLSAVARINDKLRDAPSYLGTSSTAAEVYATQTISAFGQDGVTLGTSSLSSYPNNSGESYINWFFRRAPSFFDEVCYTGTGANLSVSHNLGMAPQLWIVKGRNGATDWMVGSSLLANTEYLFLNATLAKQTAGGSAMWDSTYPTASTLYLGTASSVNNSASNTYVAYLFATCAGISKVGSITVTAGQQINVNCGFTAGARFVMMKRTDAAGDWMVFDTARGINVGNDPYLLLNSTAAEDSSWDWIAPYSAGFQFRENLYAASSTYIYLAIA